MPVFRSIVRTYVRTGHTVCRTACCVGKRTVRLRTYRKYCNTYLTVRGDHIKTWRLCFIATAKQPRLTITAPSDRDVGPMLPRSRNTHNSVANSRRATISSFLRAMSVHHSHNFVTLRNFTPSLANTLFVCSSRPRLSL